jgi:protein-disulfide isomerase
MQDKTKERLMATHGIQVGPDGVAGASATPVPDIEIDTYIDYMCPFCRRFERANGAALRELVSDGKATWRVHPLAFLDRLSNGTDYSTRSGAAAFAVAKLAPRAFGQFHEALLAHQPREGSDGLDDATIAQIAADAGMPASLTAQLTDQEFVEAVLRETESALDLGVQGTPTVLASRVGVGRVMWDGEATMPEMVTQLQQP